MSNSQSEGGTPNGVMKLPGRVMAGGVVPAGGFWFSGLVFFSAPPRPGPSRTHDPPATSPTTFPTKVRTSLTKNNVLVKNKVANYHNSAVRRATELILGMVYTSRPARNS